MAQLPGQGRVVGGTATRTGWSGGWHSYQDRVEWWVAQLPGQGRVVGGTGTRTGWSGGWHWNQDRVEWWVALEPRQGRVVAGTANRTGWSGGWHCYQFPQRPTQGSQAGNSYYSPTPQDAILSDNPPHQWPGHRGQELKAKLP